MINTLLFDYAKERANQGADWEWFKAEALPPDSREISVWVIAGAVAPLVTRGPHKGRRNFKRRDRKTERVIYITPAEYSAWVTEWTKRTGLCSHCVGEGKTVAGYNSLTKITTFAECRFCSGSGKAVQP